jgi:rRNA-processing protein FCF1
VSRSALAPYRALQILHSYQISHNIKAPFKVALDGEFLQAALAGQIMLKEQLPKLLQEERTTVFVTPCVDNWLRLKGPVYSGALHIASKLDHLKCRHDKGFGEWRAQRRGDQARTQCAPFHQLCAPF